jgi:hypothetical protein
VRCRADFGAEPARERPPAHCGASGEGVGGVFVVQVL